MRTKTIVTLHTSGQVFTLANGAISWRSRQQKTVALSVAEAEYIELAETAKQAVWLRSFSQEIGRSPTHPTTICADNQAAIFLATNPAQQTRIKHMDIRYHYIQEQVEDRRVTICHIPGEDNPAGLFTKPLGRIKVEKFKESIGLCQNLSLCSTVVGRHLGCPRCTVIGTQCV